MSTRTERPPKFSLGEVVSTAHAMVTLASTDLQLALHRHVTGDWGEVGEQDWEANEQSLLWGDRLLSVYRSAKGVKFWIITEADRSVTTVLLPDDY